MDYATESPGGKGSDPRNPLSQKATRHHIGFSLALYGLFQPRNGPFKQTPSSLQLVSTRERVSKGRGQSFCARWICCLEGPAPLGPIADCPTRTSTSGSGQSQTPPVAGFSGERGRAASSPDARDLIPRVTGESGRRFPWIRSEARYILSLPGLEGGCPAPEHSGPTTLGRCTSVDLFHTEGAIR